MKITYLILRRHGCWSSLWALQLGPVDLFLLLCLNPQVHNPVVPEGAITSILESVCVFILGKPKDQL